MILELSNNLNKRANSKSSSNNYAQVISFDKGSRANTRSAFSFLESFDLLSNDVRNSTRIGIQNVTRGHNKFLFTGTATSPLEVRFVGSGYGVSARSDTNSNRKDTSLRFQNQAAFGFDINDITDADLNKTKWISNADQVFGYFYAGFEKKDKNNPEHNQVQRQRSQEGGRAVDVKVEASNQEVDYSNSSSAYQGGKWSVFEILHEFSLTEEQVG